MSEQNEVRIGEDQLAPSITYIRDEKEVTTLMSFGLLNVLMQSIGNYENIALVGADPMFNDLILRRFLVERNKAGKPLSKYTDEAGKERMLHELESIYDVEVSPEDAERILFFVQCHMANFMLRSLKNAAETNIKSQTAQKQLSTSMSGLIGSLPSASKTPAASSSTEP